MKRAPVWMLGSLLGWVVAVQGARADGPEPDFEAAARAYREGQTAEREAKPAEAARWFELADSIAPTVQALRHAIRSHAAADQDSRAATLALVAQRRYTDRETKTLVKGVLADSGASLARLTVRCGVPCELLCDGQALSARPESEFDVFVKPGNHVISARFDSREAVAQQVDLGPGERLILSLETRGGAMPPRPTTNVSFSSTPLTAIPAATPTAPSTNDRGAPPWLFWSAAGLTTVAGTAAIISAFDTLNRSDEYRMDRTVDRYYNGIRSQRRTNLLFLGTGVAAALTVGLAFFTDWQGETSVAPKVDLANKGASLQLNRRF